MSDMNDSPSSLAPEHGFWDYTAPGAGGMEGFEKEDFQRLLDDMSTAGMNSVCIQPKWITTGYRSRLKFLDQSPDNLMIRSDNRLLIDFFSEARKRGIKTWLSAVGNMLPVDKVKATPWRSSDEAFRTSIPIKYGVYDLDSSEIADCTVRIFGELAELFPGVDGFVVEVEHSGIEAPHRIPLYNQWAEQNGRPRFDQVAHPLQVRLPDFSPWRDYSSYRRAELMNQIEAEVRRKGFAGELAMLCETGRQPYLLTQEVNLKDFHQRCPDWAAVTYEYSYNKAVNRFGMMEMCIEEPKKAGLKTYYLPRGVMTFAFPETWPMPLTIEQSWQLDLEDIQRFQPDGIWWFGAGIGVVPEGAHVSLKRLQESGYKDGHKARQAFLKTIAAFCNPRSSNSA